MFVKIHVSNLIYESTIEKCPCPSSRILLTKFVLVSMWISVLFMVKSWSDSNSFKTIEDKKRKINTVVDEEGEFTDITFVGLGKKYQVTVSAL